MQVANVGFALTMSAVLWPFACTCERSQVLSRSPVLATVLAALKS